MKNIGRTLINNICQVILGKRPFIELVVTGLLAEGHVLIEDVPGVGKTYLARSLARSIKADLKRIQFTPDLLPSDITGVSIWRQVSGDFEFQRGPIFTNILLGDELNRATPRTQSALLEAMQEKQVTVDGETFALADLFFVIATQNPLEQQGVYPLPEAQKDRFIMQIAIGYPSKDIEMDMLEAQKESHPIDELESVASVNEILGARRDVRKIHVDDTIRKYIVDLVHKSRSHGDVVLGGSPRSSIFLFRAAQALAFIRGEKFVAPDFVKDVYPHVMRHRLMLRPEARLSGITPDDVLSNIADEVPVPTKKLR